MGEYKVALLVHSCDRYQFLYPGFEYFFNKYWDTDIPCTYYFGSEEIEVELKNFTNIKSGKGEWSDRLLALLEQIPEKHILYFQEDMWLKKPVNFNFFDALFVHANEKVWNQVKLNSSDVYVTNPTEVFIEGFNVGRINNSKSRFLMSHQITLWEKSFLKKQILKKENPWRNERRGSKRLKNLNASIFHIDYFEENFSGFNNKNLQGIKRSCYKNISENGTLGNNILPFIDELEKDDALVKYKEKLKINFQNKITHDGLTKPLKKDIFKKMKEWIKSKMS